MLEITSILHYYMLKRYLQCNLGNHLQNILRGSEVVPHPQRCFLSLACFLVGGQRPRSHLSLSRFLTRQLGLVKAAQGHAVVAFA